MMISLPDRHCEPLPQTAPLSIAERAGDRVRRAWLGFRARRRRRATIFTLQGLDDRTLSDIGLDRSEIASVVEQRCGASERRQHVLASLFRT